MKGYQDCGVVWGTFLGSLTATVVKGIGPCFAVMRMCFLVVVGCVV